MPRPNLLAFALIPLAASAALAQAPAPIAQVTAHLQAIDTMTANFTQTDRNGRILSGVMTLKRPGKLRFQYQPGVPMLIVADGKRLFMIDYETRHVDNYPIGNTPLDVLLDAKPNLARIAKVVHDEPQNLVIETRDPKRPQYGTITMGFSRGSGPAGLTLQGWTVLDAQNNRTTVRLSNQRFNVAIGDDSFRWNDPRRAGPKH
jgi:outer membrane lipoprotein-sorting protein